jgi:glyoxylase-like metal-dependent hydrolase (beta-lactamase superfamily II)
MRIRKAGKITEHLWRLGTEESCVYLLEGNKSSVIISGGMNYIIPEMMRQIKEFGIDERKIAHIIILHAHFDHMGIVPFFKRRWPQITVYASKRGWGIITNPKAIAVINKFSDLVAQKVSGEMADMSLLDWTWRDDVKGVAVAEGKKIDLGGIKLKIYETPGHSSCSISAYVPEIKALFASDAVAIPFKDDMFIAANSSFTQYQQSLEKLRKLDVKILGCDHYAHMIDDEATSHIIDSIDAARKMRAELEGLLRKEGGIDEAAKSYVDDYYKKTPDYFLAPEIMLGVYRQMLKHLAEDMIGQKTVI